MNDRCPGKLDRLRLGLWHGIYLLNLEIDVNSLLKITGLASLRLRKYGLRSL